MMSIKGGELIEKKGQKTYCKKYTDFFRRHNYYLLDCPAACLDVHIQYQPYKTST